VIKSREFARHYHLTLEPRGVRLTYWCQPGGVCVARGALRHKDCISAVIDSFWPQLSPRSRSPPAQTLTCPQCPHADSQQDSPDTCSRCFSFPASKLVARRLSLARPPASRSASQLVRPRASKPSAWRQPNQSSRLLGGGRPPRRTRQWRISIPRRCQPFGPSWIQPIAHRNFSRCVPDPVVAARPDLRVFTQQSRLSPASAFATAVDDRADPRGGLERPRDIAIRQAGSVAPNEVPTPPQDSRSSRAKPSAGAPLPAEAAL